MDSNTTNEDNVPCELCNHMVHFSEYEEHIRTCRINTQPSSFFSYHDMDSGVFNIQLPNLHDLFFPGRDPSNTHTTFTIITFSEPEEIQVMSEYEVNMLLSEMIGNVEKGINDIDSVCSVVDKSELDADHQDDLCPICRENISSTNDVVIVRTICNHLFCKDCIQGWLKAHKKCPVCMIDLEDFKNEKIDKDKSEQHNCT